jgi:hypothetical protein
MQHELTIRSTDNGLSSIRLVVPRGRSGEGLALLDRMLPAIHELDRRVREQTNGGPIGQAREHRG